MKAIAALKDANPALKVGLVGAQAAVDAEGTLKAARIVDFAARNEFDFKANVPRATLEVMRTMA